MPDFPNPSPSLCPSHLLLVSLFSLVNTKNNTNTNTNTDTNTNTNSNTNTFLLDYISVKCKFKSKSQFLIQTSATMKGYCLLVVVGLKDNVCFIFGRKSL